MVNSLGFRKLKTINPFYKVIAAGICLVMFPLASLAVETASIVVNVSGLNNDKGVIRIALFNDKDKYSRDKGTAADAFQKEAVSIKDKTVSHTFTNIPYGDYAIKVYHDEDNSGRFYTGAFGIPKVQYGFSNNAKGAFGPASFEKAKFSLQTKEVIQNIQLSGK
jgi:uncharacterized protein (DUF2141 family)